MYLINTLNYDDNFQIISAEYIGTRRWNLTIKDRLKVKLPEKDYFSAIKNLNKLLNKLEDFDYSTIEFIDLRLPKKAIIRFYNNDEIDFLNEL